MNKDINKTLMALVPILRMNGENVTSIEAVHDWYKVGDREYKKEVAEITYDNGTVRYADIGCDSNLTAIYDVIAVIQQIKPRSKAIERIERGVYSLPSAQPDFDTDQKINKAYDDGYDQGYLQCKTDQDGTMEQEKRMSEWMIFAERLSEQMKKQNLSIRQLAERMDMTTTTIYRYANGQRVPRANEILKASDALGVTCDYLLGLSDDPKKTSRSSAEPERKKGRWIPHKSIFGGPDEKVYECNQCGYNIGFHTENFCPNCGTDMRGEQDE